MRCGFITGHCEGEYISSNRVCLDYLRFFWCDISIAHTIHHQICGICHALINWRGLWLFCWLWFYFWLHLRLYFRFYYWRLLFLLFWWLILCRKTLYKIRRINTVLIISSFNLAGFCTNIIQVVLCALECCRIVKLHGICQLFTCCGFFLAQCVGLVA